MFDTNALFDAYRLNSLGSTEFVRTLGLLGDRLWVPHRVADEFLKGRLGIIDECAKAVAKLGSDLGSSFRKIKDDLQHFGGRRGLGKDQVGELVKVLHETQVHITDKVAELYRFDLKAAASQAHDPILAEIEKLLQGRIGPPLADMRKVREEAAYRYERQIPPGYADADKPVEQAIGDYVLWVQLLEEVERRPLPVLFVTNESKTAEDWVVQQPGGRSPLPRAELSAEVWERARQPFHIVNVRSFLELANEFLDAQVSKETITQAQEIVEALDVSSVERNFRDFLATNSSKNPVLAENSRSGEALANYLASLPEDSLEARYLRGEIQEPSKALSWFVLLKGTLDYLTQQRTNDPDTAADPDEPE